MANISVIPIQLPKNITITAPNEISEEPIISQEKTRVDKPILETTKNESISKYLEQDDDDFEDEKVLKNPNRNTENIIVSRNITYNTILSTKPAFTPLPDGIQISASFLIGHSIQEIDWCGDSYDVIFVRNNNGSIYRSSGKGKSFRTITQKLIDIGEASIDDTESIGLAVNIIRSKALPSTLIIIGSTGIDWITNDCG